MKAAVFEGVRSVRLQERPYPKIGPTEAIIKVKYCGICGTDVHSYTHGRANTSSLVLGHEVVGVVAELGKDVKGWNIGDRVLVGPPVCGECYYCLHGQPHICIHKSERVAGLSPGVDGGMAEYEKIAFPNLSLTLIPDEVSFEDAVLTDTIAVSFHALRISNFHVGDNAVVSGAGPIGLAAIDFLRIGGARHITALQPSPMKRQMALKYGADLALNPVEEGAGLGKKVAALYGGVGAEVAFECAGTPESFHASLAVVKGGGQVILAGTNNIQSPMAESQFARGEIETKGSHVYLKEEGAICLDFMAKRRLKTEGMISDIIKLDDIVEKGFERLANSRSNLVKVVVAP